MSDHIDRAEILIHNTIFATGGENARTSPGLAVRALEDAGLLVTPAHDAAVAAKAAERVLAVICDDLDTVRASHQAAHSWDDALHFVRGYVSGAAINTRAEHMEREGEA